MVALLGLQRADGRWDASAELAAALGLSLPLLQEPPPTETAVEGWVWATIAVLVVLHAQEAPLRALWTLAAGKAHRCVSRTTKWTLSGLDVWAASLGGGAVEGVVALPPSMLAALRSAVIGSV